MVINLKLEHLKQAEEASHFRKEEGDQLLVKGLKAQNRTAQANFYKSYFGKMFPTALRYSSNKEDAHDIINTAFMKVITNIDKYKDQGKFGAWVRTIVKRSAIDYCRKFRYKEAPTFELIEVDQYTYNNALANLAVEEIIELLQQLPPASRAVFNLYIFEDLPHKEIAAKLSISIGTSKWHLANARKLLLDLINQQNK